MLEFRLKYNRADLLCFNPGTIIKFIEFEEPWKAFDIREKWTVQRNETERCP